MQFEWEAQEESSGRLCACVVVGRNKEGKRQATENTIGCEKGKRKVKSDGMARTGANALQAKKPNSLY